jgi:hypothetical protein
MAGNAEIGIGQRVKRQWRPGYFRSLKEVLVRNRVRALATPLAMRRPVGVSGKDWAASARRSVYRNGWQRRRREALFNEALVFIRSRRKERFYSPYKPVK